MSRSNYEEDWERKKSHLIRNLFEEVPNLSTIHEERISQVGPSTDYFQKRPYSPLPDLNIERAPNKHDEPEEYYEELTVRMRKAYRKIFGTDDRKYSVDDKMSSVETLLLHENLEVASQVSSGPNKTDSETLQTASDNDQDSFKQIDESRDIKSFKEENEDESFIGEDNSSYLYEENFTDSSVSIERAFHKKSLSTILEETTTDSSKQTENKILTKPFTKKSVDHKHENCETQEITNPLRSSKESLLSFERLEVELMRSHKDYNPLMDKSFIVPNTSLHSSPSTNSLDFESLSRHRSSPKVEERKRKSIEVDLNKNITKQIVVTKKTKKDVSVQTSVASTSMNWDTIKRNIFIGTPKVFNLCTCKNHRCD